MDIYLSRADWGANRNLPRLGFPVDPLKRTEIHVHHTAAVDTSDFTKNRWSKKNAIKYMRALQTIRPDLGKDIPYTETFFVLENLDVAIMEGRGLWRTGAHTAGHNTAGFGWSAAGNFDLGDPQAVRALIGSMSNRYRWLKSQQFKNLGTSHPDGRVAYGHRDTKSTACPGQHLYAALDGFGEIPKAAGTPVMGAAEVPVDQALAFVASKDPGYSPPTVEKIVRGTYSIAADDGVRGDIALCLMRKETGDFRYGGYVRPEQWNFGGIGATGGVPGLSFPNIEAGVRAVVRRMRMYAVDDPAFYDETILGRSLPRVNTPDHPRGFKGWGKHPNIEDFGGAWATPGVGYGESIVAMVELMKQTAVPSAPPSPFTAAQTDWLDNRYVRR